MLGREPFCCEGMFDGAKVSVGDIDGMADNPVDGKTDELTDGEEEGNVEGTTNDAGQGISLGSELGLYQEQN